jgi:hypothetical protein
MLTFGLKLSLGSSLGDDPTSHSDHRVRCQFKIYGLSVHEASSIFLGTPCDVYQLRRASKKWRD